MSRVRGGAAFINDQRTKDQGKTLPVMRSVPSPRPAPLAQPSDPLQGRTFHPLALEFPALDPERLEDLAADLRQRLAQGQKQTLLVSGDTIVDDHNLAAACTLAGVELDFKPWDRNGSVADLIAKAMIPRSLLKESQRAAVAVPVCEHLMKEGAQRRNGTLIPNARDAKKAASCGGQDFTKTAIPEKLLDVANLPHPVNAESCGETEQGESWGKSRDHAAELCGVSSRYVSDAWKLKRQEPELFAEVKNGKMNLNKAMVFASRKAIEKAVAFPSPLAPRPSAPGRIIVGDCLPLMTSMLEKGHKDFEKSERFDLIFADPPYNNGTRYDADAGRDRLAEPVYLAWSEAWIHTACNLVSRNGAIVVMIDARWQSRFDAMLRSSRCGLEWRNTIVWHDPFPCNTDDRFQPAARYLHYYARGDWTWNADAVRVESERDRLKDARRVHSKGIVLHDVWGPHSPQVACPGCGELVDLDAPGGGPKIPRIVGNAAERVPFADCPPQVPSAILRRIIAALTNPGDKVLDPFCGNGTTWRACVELGRDFTGIERSPLYARQAAIWAGQAKGEV